MRWLRRLWNWLRGISNIAWIWSIAGSFTTTAIAAVLAWVLGLPTSLILLVGLAVALVVLASCVTWGTGVTRYVTNLRHEERVSQGAISAVSIEDDSIAGCSSPLRIPMWRIKVKNAGDPEPLAVYVEELSGTGGSEEGYFAKWRMDDVRYIGVGDLAQPAEIARVTNDVNELFRAAFRRGRSQSEHANALDFLSDHGFFTRQVELNGSLRMTIAVVNQRGQVRGRRTFELGITDGPDGVPRMRPVDVRPVPSVAAGVRRVPRDEPSTSD